MLSISSTHPPIRHLGLSDHGRLIVSAAAPVHVVAPTRDVLLVPRSPALVSFLGIPPDFVDPVSAVWCAGGDELICRPFSGASDECVRFDWIAVDRLAEAIPAAAGFLREALDRRLTLVLPLPPALYLVQRIASHEAGEEVPEPPARAWRPAAPVATRPVPGASRNGPDPGAALARRGREYLSRTYRESLPVARIARHLGCSDGHLSRSFKRGTGLTLVGYRHELRMRAALDRLETGGERLDALARALGYASHSHFTTRFERTFGLTPSAYRRLARTFGSPPERELRPARTS